MLRISPPAEWGQYSFIYLAAQELPDKAAIITYFENANREVSVLPCLDFDRFLTFNSLQTCQVSFVNDLPNYILSMGHQILEENAYFVEANHGYDIHFWSRQGHFFHKMARPTSIPLMLPLGLWAPMPPAHIQPIRLIALT
jgi:hypothetical protein